MSKAGLSFANPFMEKTNVGPAPNPYAPYTPTVGMGMDNLGPSSTDMAVLGQQLVKGTQFTMPAMEAPPPDIGINEGTGQLFVQGRTFAGDDAAAALEVEALLDQPGKNALPAGYTALSPEAYRQWTAGIRNPTMGQLARKSFGRGVDVQQQLAGQFLQFAGAEKLGGDIVAAQEEELRKSSPYSRAATDIGQPNRGVLDWFVGNLAEQGPNLVISALTGGAGAAGGAMALNASSRALGKQFLKTSNVQSTMAAAKKYAANPASLNPAEVKLLHEAASVTAAAQIARGEVFDTLAEGARVAATGNALNQARLTGAGVALGTQNYATGIADIYGNTMESGNPDRALAATLGIPYAALESLSEFVLASRIFGTGGANRATIRSIQGAGAKTGAVAGRALSGLAVGGTLEGTTEAAQESLNLFAGDVDWDSPDGINRLANSFAAGFGVGGTIGGIANIPGNAPVNLLNQSNTTEPSGSTGRIATERDFTAPPPPPFPGATMPPGTAPGTQPDMFGGVGEFTPAPGFAPAPSPVSVESGLLTEGEIMRRGDATAAALPARQDLLAQKQNLEQLIATAGEQANAMGSGAIPFDSMRLQQLNQQVANARAAVAQIDQALGQMSAGPLEPGPPQMDFGYPVNPAAATPLPQVIDQTLPPPPGAGTPAAETRMGQLLQTLGGAQRDARPVPLAQVVDETLPPPMPETPTTPANLTNLATSLAFQNLRRGQQGQLFPPGEVMPNARGTPVLPGRTPLKRGVKATPEPAPISQAELEAAGQTSMLTATTGQPSAAGMRAAGTLPPLAPRKRGLKRPAAAKEQEVEQVYEDGSSFTGIIGKDEGLLKGVYTYADNTEFDGTFEDNAPKEGTTKFPNGDQFTGTYDNKGNKVDGTYTSADGTVETYKSGKIVRPPKVRVARPKPQKQVAAPPLKKEATSPPKEGAAPEAAKTDSSVAEETKPEVRTFADLTPVVNVDAVVPITVTLPDGTIMKYPDGLLLINKLKTDINRFKSFLACLRK